VECLRFSGDSEFLVSLGEPNDRGLFVWDWKNEKKISSNKLSKPVLNLTFSDNNDFFVTGGYQHLKYWYLDDKGKPLIVQVGGKDSIMESKSATLDKVKVKIFVGAAIFESSVYGLTSDGFVYVFDK
jgi:WD40 repeat protein